MSFLYPSFLFGLSAIAIPVAIHLFNFRKTRRVFFTNVAFLKDIKTSTSSFRRLKHLLILMARILFVSFLVLAFAQPFIANKNATLVTPGQGGLTSIYLDNSLSMQNETGEQRFLDLAASQVEGLLNLYPSSPSVQLLTNDFESRDQYITTSAKLKDRLTEVDFSGTFRSLDAVYQRQSSLLSRHSNAAKNQLFWFSDFQRSTAGPLEKLKLDTLNQIFIVPVQGEDAANVFVDSVWLATPFVKEMETNVLNVKLLNTGKEPVKNLPVKLFIDDKQVSSSSVSLEPNTPGTAVFNFTVNTKGMKKGRISFEDFPVTFDNDYFFVINASPVINIVHLHEPQPSPYISSVFGNETIFKSRSLNIQNADLAQMATADLVVLEGLNNIDASVTTPLHAFLKKGGSVVVFPSATSDAGYAAFMSSLGIRGVQKVAATPASSAAPIGSANALNPPDTKNPFFEAIFESSTQKGLMEMPYAQPVLQWAMRGNALLSYKNGQPFLSRFDVGQGKVYVFAAPLNTTYTNLPKHALFVPILYKMASLSKQQERLAFSFQEPSIAVEVAIPEKEPVYKLKKEDFEVIPAQRINGNRLIFELPENPQTGSRQLVEAGYYELSLNGQPQKLLAFNYDRKESLMSTYSPEQLKKIFAPYKNVQVFSSVDDGSFVNDFKNQNLGRNLWKYCLIASLFFLLAEIALIRFMK
jgi:hypothetical protein